MSFVGRAGEVFASPGTIGRVIRRVEFDHALARAVRARGVELRDGVGVESVRDEGEGATLHTSEGPLRARVVVGCDGVGSVVRRSMGLGRGALHAQVIEVDTEATAGDRPRSLLHFDATEPRIHGYAWDFPTVVGGRELVCRGLYHLKTSGDDRHDGPDLAALLAERLRVQGVDPSRCRNKRYAERGVEPAADLARGRRMLVGEAAGIDPVTGEGIAQAIEYGVLAGRFLARALRAGDVGSLVDGWQREVDRSRLARDLRIRNRLMGLYYGPARAEVETFLAESPDALFVGGQHFAAQPYDLIKLIDVLARGTAHLVATGIAGMLRR